MSDTIAAREEPMGKNRLVLEENDPHIRWWRWRSVAWTPVEDIERMIGDIRQQRGVCYSCQRSEVNASQVVSRRDRYSKVQGLAGLNL